MSNTTDTSTIANMERQIADLQKQLRDAKNNSDAKNESDARNNSNVIECCGICFGSPFLPVFIVGRNSNPSCKSTVRRQCPSGQLYCTGCARQLITNLKEEGVKHTCPTGCCIIDLNQSTSKSYGEVGRDPNGPSCPNLWRQFDKLGTRGFRTECECGFESQSNMTLWKHVRYDCKNGFAKCPTCGNNMTRGELASHQENCKKFCPTCNVEVSNDEVHRCPNKSLAKCRFCKICLTMNNIEDHQDCTIVLPRNLPHKLT